MAGVPAAIEVERVMNLVRGFGWIKSEERINQGELVLVIKKKIEETPVVGPE